jgi:hypothetical protein
MKNVMNWVSMVCLALTFIACGPSSVKGKWTANDKKLIKEIYLEVMNKNFKATGQPIDDAVNGNIADCFVDKVEAEFANLDDVQANDNKREELSKSCVKEILMLQGEMQANEESATTGTTKTAQ